MATPLDVRTDRGADGIARVVAAGEIDLSNVEVFSRALRAARDGDQRSRAEVLVDLSGVKYLDSAAINVLFTHADDVEHLHLIVHPFLMPVLTISGLGEIATVESAPAAVRDPEA
ncbi:MAG: STAS domain-containing protein [Mycobacterium sp.]|nr:STAS domain-containing protein [Mycobacterium sp.]